MKKNQTAVSLRSLICLSVYVFSYPVLATDPTSSDAGAALRSNEITSKSDGTVQTNTPPPGVKKSTLPKKIFSLATAFVIGTPVCVVRRSKYEEWYGVHGMIGDSESKCKKVLAGAFWFPFAVITGTLEAPFDAVANGLMYPALSKDQLSQGKLIQNN